MVYDTSFVYKTFPVSEVNFYIYSFIYNIYIFSEHLPLSPDALSPRARDLYYKVKKFIREEVIPVEEAILKGGRPQNPWEPDPRIDVVKVRQI